MIAGVHIDNCGACGHAVTYRKEPSVPIGWVFKCTNVLCGYYGQEHMMPTIKALRFYPAPAQDAA